MPKELKSYPAETKLVRSFGRIKTRKLSDHKNDLLDNLYPQYEFKNHEFTTARKFKKICLEIGFGFGDFLYQKAKNNPDTLFLGSEPHINGIVNVLAKLEKEPLDNLKISKEDVRVTLADFPEEFFDEIYILFPDPWPKLKHFKRRLINTDFLDFIAKKMTSESQLTIATDHDSYKTWILSEIMKNNSFTWLAKRKKDWQQFPDWWIETKYQKKAASEGRVSVIFNLIKND